MTPTPLSIITGLMLSTLIGGLAYRRGSLTRSGWIGAILTGTLTFGFGGLAWGAALVLFFVTSSLLSKFRRAYKEQVAGEKFEKGGRRDLWQALANGGIGALLALLAGLMGHPDTLLALFAGVMATVTADTWATELGVLSKTRPRLITTWLPVEPGTSGGVSAIGLLASAAGAGTIGLGLLFFIGVEQGIWRVWVLPAALLGGLIGSLADSLLGATLQAMYTGPHGETERRATRDGSPTQLMRGIPWMQNDMVNFLSSLIGGITALIVVLCFMSLYPLR
jgi:uncharacterized protein (TIGR00297 family)